MQKKCAKRVYNALFIVFLLPFLSYAQNVRMVGPADMYARVVPGCDQVERGVKMPSHMLKVRHVAQPGIKNARSVVAKVDSKASQIPLAATASNAKLYGNLIYSSSMASTGDMSQVGYYSINPNTGAYTPVACNQSLSGAGTVVDGTAYVSYIEQILGMVFGIYTFVFDIESATITNVFVHDVKTYESYSINMAYDPLDRIIYSLNYSADAEYINLCTFDPVTGVYTPIAPAAEYLAMTFDDEGNLYVIDGTATVYKLDKETGKPGDVVAKVDFEPAFMQSACWSPLDKKIIWAASNEKSSKLIAIDPISGASEVLTSFSDVAEFTSLYTTDLLAPEDAPAAPKIAISYRESGSNTANYTVTAPVENVVGEKLDLSQAINTVFIIDGKNLTEKSLKPGETLSGSVILEEGKHALRAYSVNSAGRGLLASAYTYTGEDAPAGVQNLKTTMGSDRIVLTWDAPQIGVNGGWVNPSTLYYNVSRNGEVIAENVTECSYTDVLPSDMTAYVYAVTGYSRNKQGATVTTDRILFGDAIALPYSQIFDTPNSLDLYTIVDRNDDNNTWYYSESTKTIVYQYLYANPGDDYLITPALDLPSGRLVKAKVTVNAEGAKWPEAMEITVGPDCDPANHTVLYSNKNVNWETPQTVQTYFEVPTSGSYHIGVRVCSPANSYYLHVSGIEVENGPRLDAPKAVTNVTATPAGEGKLSATINFTAPTHAMNDKPLTGNLTVKAFRADGTPVGETSVAPGATGKITDNAAVNGTNVYTILAANASGDGDDVEVSCLCGYDVPAIVEELSVLTSADNMSAELSWDAPTVGANGGYIDANDLIYTIYKPIVDDAELNMVYVGETSQRSFKITADGERLQSYEYYVSARNIGGESDLSGCVVVLGKPYVLPFVERIPGKYFETSPWLIIGEGENSVTWGLGSVMQGASLTTPITAPDGGMAVCYDSEGGEGGVCSLKVPKITIAGMKSPYLYFSMYHYAGATASDKLTIKLTTDDANYATVVTKNVSGASGWVEYKVSLDAYKNNSWIGLLFEGEVSKGNCVCIDYVRVENDSEYDVTIQAVNQVAEVVLGNEATLEVDVLNNGSKSVAGYSLYLYVNDELLATHNESESLAAGSSRKHSMKVATTADMINKAEVVAQVTMSGDEVPGNDRATAQLVVKQPHLRVVTDLSGKGDYSLKNVTLSWSNPSILPDAFVDDFETYNAFSSSLRKYKLIDGDGEYTYSPDGGVEFPGYDEAKGFIVWQPSRTTPPMTSANWQPHSGNKCMIAFSTPNGAVDDWLISPQIIGGTIISFWAAIPTTQYGYETFEVLYSTTDREVSSFKVLDSITKSVTDWEKYTYMLPADAKYFAIRYTSVRIFALLIDDLSYIERGGGNTLSVQGYNIYCNGEKINQQPIPDTEYAYSSATASDALSFGVTVVYEEGESMMSNLLHFTSGVDAVEVADVVAYGIDDAVVVEHATGSPIEIYSIEGRLIRRVDSAMYREVVMMPQGVYIVRVKDYAAKVIVG